MRLYSTEICSATSSWETQSCIAILKTREHVDNITVFVDSDLASDVVSRKGTTGLVAQIGNHTVKFGSTLQSLAALSVEEAEFYAVVKGCQVGLFLGSMCQDLGIPMKIELQSDSSTANSLTDRLGAGQRTKHIDTRYFWIQERVQDGDLSIKKVSTAKNCTDVGTKPLSASVLHQTLQICRIGITLTIDPTFPLQEDGTSVAIESTSEVQNRKQKTETENCQNWLWTSRRVESWVKPLELWKSWALFTMNDHDGRRRERKRREARNVQRETEWTLTDRTLAITWKSPRQRDDGSDGYASTSGLGCVRTRAVDAPDGLDENQLAALTHWLDWLGENRLPDLKSGERVTPCKVSTCLLLFWTWFGEPVLTRLLRHRFPVRTVLPSYARPKSAGQAHFRTNTEEFGYLAGVRSPHRLWAQGVRQDYFCRRWHDAHQRSEPQQHLWLLKNHTREHWTVPCSTIFETFVSHDSRGDFDLQQESQESMPRETVARESERGKRRFCDQCSRVDVKEKSTEQY